MQREKGAQKSPPEDGDLWKAHGYLVPETGIEPVRPLLTKAADFKSTVLQTTFNTAMILAHTISAVRKGRANKQLNRSKTALTMLLHVVGKITAIV